MLARDVTLYIIYPTTSQQVTTSKPTTQPSTTTGYINTTFNPPTTTKASPTPSHTSTSPPTWPQTITQPISETANSSTLTQTLQITNHLYYTSAYATSHHPPTTPTRSMASTYHSHIPRHLIRHSTTSLPAPIQTDDHLEAQFPHSTINHTQITNSTMSSTTGAIHPQPTSTRQPLQPTAPLLQTASTNHTKVHPSSDHQHTPPTPIQLPTHGLPYWPPADTILSTQPVTTYRHTITSTSTTRDPTIYECARLQTATGDSHHGPTEGRLASTTLAAFPTSQHSTSHHPHRP